MKTRGQRPAGTKLSARAPAALSADVDRVLRTRFGLSCLRPGQAEAIAAALAGRDVLACFATGAGKSLCYQLPAVVLHARGRGTTWVVSPLVALMEDQTRALRARGVQAVALHGQMTPEARGRAWAEVARGDCALVYLAPERALLPHVLQLATQSRAALLAIDEAHCVSQWGHDFRPEYRQLRALREALHAPTVAVTATATPEVGRDIVHTLGLKRPLTLRGPVVRSNLALAVQGPLPRPTRLERLVEALQAAPGGRRLVYAATRAMAEATAKFLATAKVGEVVLYHAGLAEAVRRRAQAAYAEAHGTPPILVATPAFGMGIDQPDVRLVAHVQAPGSPEAYYQEAGRAGRDGVAARCLLLWGRDDWPLQRRLASSGSPRARARAAELLVQLRGYVEGTGCRQQFFVDYFGGENAATAHDEAILLGAPPTDNLPPAPRWACGHCDACRGEARGAPPPRQGHAAAAPPPLQADARVALEAAVLAAAQQLSRPVGAGLLTQALRGSRSQTVVRRGLSKIPSYGTLRGAAAVHVQQAITALLAAGSLEPRGRKYPTVWPAGRALRAARAPRGGTPASLASELKNFGRRKARALGWKKAYLVLPRALAAQIVSARPRSLAELAALRGMGPKKLERFGAELLAIVHSFEARRTKW